LEEPKEEQPEVISEGAVEYPVLRPLKLPESESQLDPESPSSVRICQGIDSPILLSSPIKSFRSSFEQLTRTLSGRFSNNPSERGCTTADEENIETSDHQADEKDVVVAVVFTNNNNNNNKKIVNTQNEKDVPVEACKEENKIQMLSGRDDGFGHNKKTSLLSNWALMASIAVYCFWSLQDIAYTEVHVKIPFYLFSYLSNLLLGMMNRRISFSVNRITDSMPHVSQIYAWIRAL
jgi:hypothetical protein